MQARVRLARNAGESAFWPGPAQGDESHVRAYLGSWKMRTGDLLVQL